MFGEIVHLGYVISCAKLIDRSARPAERNERTGRSKDLLNFRASASTDPRAPDD